jgi:CheY-like chemotaxis protein
MPDGGRLQVTTSTSELDADYARAHPGVKPGRYAMIVVSDTGRGMSAEVVGTAFEPFFTTKAKGRGTGLGLATVYGIVKQNGGHIALYSGEGTGTVARVFLPLSERRADAPAAAEPEVPEAAANEKILVVEDEEDVRRVIERILDAAGYRVVCAERGEIALELAAATVFDLVVTDVVMPGMSGPQLIARLRETRPGLRALFTSGYTDRPGALPDDAVFLSKPFSRRSLLEHVAQVLAG